MNFKSSEINNIDIYSIFEEVLNGKRRRFPNSFWDGDDGKKRGVTLFKYLIEDNLRLNELEIKEKINVKFFTTHKLGGMLAICYNQSHFEIISDVYPDKYKPWEFSSVPNGYWTVDTAINAVKWLVEERLILRKNDIPQITAKDFIDNGLITAFNIFHQSVARAIMEVYPNDFKEWEFKSVPKHYWNDKTINEALNWLFNDRFQWDEKYIVENIDTKVFEENGLGGVLYKYFNSSPYEVVNYLFPDKYRQWELKYCPNKFWTKETAKEATKWLYEEKLRYSQEEILKKVRAQTFVDHGLSTVIIKIYEGSPMKAFKDVYQI